MRAKDVMTTHVLTVDAGASVKDVARKLIDHRISAVPVVDTENNVVGIVSEGDLVRRSESETERHSPWWLFLVEEPEEKAIAYIKSHGRLAKDVMTRKVLTASEETTLEEIATLLEENRIKRVPIVRENKLVGIVSRANLLHGLVASKITKETTVNDATIRSSIMNELPKEAGVLIGLIDVTVSDGIVHLWGAVESESEKTAAGLVVENTPGVREVKNHLGILPPMVRSVLWAE